MNDWDAFIESVKSSIRHAPLNCATYTAGVNTMMTHVSSFGEFTLELQEDQWSHEIIVRFYISDGHYIHKITMYRIATRSHQTIAEDFDLIIDNPWPWVMRYGSNERDLYLSRCFAKASRNEAIEIIKHCIRVIDPANLQNILKSSVLSNTEIQQVVDNSRVAKELE